MKNENHVIKNLQKHDKLMRKTWDKKVKKKLIQSFGVFKFKEIGESLESLRTRNITFLFQSFERKRENVFFFLYKETKISVRLNIFGLEEFSTYKKTSQEFF